VLWVVIREIEQNRSEEAVFQTVDAAQSCYDEATYVSDNGPDDGPGDDPTIVTNSWLYEADTSDADTARAMARDGRAILIKSYA
jgi:hypothetical protein